jgi:hypothetical protein
MGPQTPAGKHERLSLNGPESAKNVTKSGNHVTIPNGINGNFTTAYFKQ